LAFGKPASLKTNIIKDKISRVILKWISSVFLWIGYILETLHFTQQTLFGRLDLSRWKIIVVSFLVKRELYIVRE
jgi:hypothetical protein